jgi:hypothetical protein
VQGFSKGWSCHHYLPGCTWEGAGCALGKTSKVSPELPEQCIRDHAPFHLQVVANTDFVNPKFNPLLREAFIKRDANRFELKFKQTDKDSEAAHK